MNTSITSLSAKQLRRAANLKERIEGLNRELSGMLGTPGDESAAPVKRRKVSAAGIARIRAAAKKRWAKIKATTGRAKPRRKRRRKFSDAGKARLAAIAREVWRRVKGSGKTRL